MDRHDIFEWDQYGGDAPSFEKGETHSRHEFMISDDFNTSYTYGSYVDTISARYNRVEPGSYLRQNGESKARYFGRKFLAIKPYELLYSEYEGSELRKTLTRFDLVFVGIGAIVGTGIFVLSGHAAAEHAGPAVAISFLIAGIAAGKCYKFFAFSSKKKKLLKLMHHAHKMCFFILHRICRFIVLRNGFYDSSFWFCIYLYLRHHG